MSSEMDSVTVMPGVAVTFPAILACLTKAITFDSSTLSRVVVVSAWTSCSTSIG